MPKSKFSFPSGRVFDPWYNRQASSITFDDWDFSPSTVIDDYMSPTPGTTTIRITDTQIEIKGDWTEWWLLIALRDAEAECGQKAFWTGSHYTFPAAVLPVVEDIFKNRVDHQVNWQHEAATRDTTLTTAVFLEYCGNCRSRKGKQQQRMICKTCRGTGLAGYSALGPDCRICGGNGAIAAYPDVEPYASGWWNGGWNIRFPEKVLRAYFGEPEGKFNGNFYEALLETKDINKRYKQLARQYHPDVYKKGSQMFLKLREAYEVLRDPQRRKRYEAGLKFQLATAQVRNDVVFEVPRKCGDLLVKGNFVAVEDRQGRPPRWGTPDDDVLLPDGFSTAKRLDVTEIINWNDRIREDGCIMASTWNPNANNRGNREVLPFTITWEQPPVEFVINI